MIGYTIFGTNDLERSKTFYDAVFGAIGYKRCFELDDGFVTWGTDGMGQFAVSKPYNGEPATAGNGTMIAVSVSSKEMVAKGHEAALAAGAKDEGAPGYRPDENDPMKFYAAYFRDPEGNKLALFTIGL